MKNLLLIIVLALGVGTVSFLTLNTKVETEIAELTFKTDYEEGWEDGYCEGWKDVKGQYAYCPYAPYAPYPEYNKDTYRDGYNRGFKAGMRAAYDD